MRATPIFALAFLGAASLAAQAPAPSVAEAARRARSGERLRATRQFTEDDLPRLRRNPISIVGEPHEEDPAEAKKDPEVSREELWRQRFRDAREEVADSERALAGAGRAFDDASRRASYIMGWGILLCPRMGEVFAPGYLGAGELNATCAAVNAQRTRLELARATLLELEDELRRDGGYPGWARE